MISIVVPIYNTEKYLRKCLDSLVDQNVEKEIILIDDGSTDNSLSVAREYQIKYPFIKVFHQKNSGQSTARNRGLAEASGDYIFFCDSDDYIDKNSLRDLESICIANNLDILKTGWNTFFANGDKQVNVPPIKFEVDKVLSSRDYFLNSIKLWFNVVPWNGLIKLKHIKENNLYFPENIQFEDNYYNLILMLSNPKSRVMQIDSCFYNVNVVSNSTTTACPSPKKIYDQLANANLMNSFIEKNIKNDTKLYIACKKAVSSLIFTLTSYFYRIEKQFRNEVYNSIPRVILREAIKYPMNTFQKIKLLLFFRCRFILDIYEDGRVKNAKK